MTIPDVLDRLEGVRRSGRGWIARCPAHNDHRPSLSIAAGRDDRILVHCFARQCDYRAILNAIGLDAGPPRSSRPVSALALARQERWYPEEVRLIYAIGDYVRHCRRAADRLRRAVTASGDTEAAWLAAARTAEYERDGQRIEHALDEALSSWP
jgi:hypothetical protein